MIPRIRKLKSPSLLGSILIVVFVLAGLALFDNLIHDPLNQPTAHLVLAAVDFYQGGPAGVIAPPGTCKFVPTCSDYMGLAVLKYGSVRGVFKGLWRICRCSPFTSQSGFDYP